VVSFQAPIDSDPKYKRITRRQMTPGQYTELFFLDEAVARHEMPSNARGWL
jgi:hypothetical protein